MKIAYLGQMADIATENGISKKIVSQATHWQRAGHVVRYFSLVPTTVVWRGFESIPTGLLARGSIAQRLLRSFTLASRVRAWRPDVIYFRYAYHSPGFPALFRQIPTVAEINSDDITEYPTTLSTAKVAYHRLTRGRVLTAVTGFVAVTHELAKRFASFGKPTEVIANGIDLDDFDAAPALAVDQPIHLVFIGSAGTPWHGLDRVAELARQFPEFEFDVVGGTAANWRESAGTTPPINLHFHGQLDREAYEPMLHSATAAIGTMALYRKQMDEACPLKVREYLAAGLPVIGGYHDTDIPPTADYFLELPNRANSLDSQHEKIATWLAGWQGRRVSRAAVNHLDNKPKEERRLKFLAQLA